MDHLGFTISSASVLGNTLVARYYNPEIPARIAELRARRELIQLGDLIANGQVTVAAGDEIGKMAYGTGRIPFVRTSDLVNYEVKGEPKQGVSRDIHDRYALRQEVTDGDVLFVRDGTYLIGNTAMVRWLLVRTCRCSSSRTSCGSGSRKVHPSIATSSWPP